METTRIEKNGTLSKAGLSMTPAEWLKFNYNLSIGDEIKVGKASEIIREIKVTDNVGHFRTNYPVVIGVDPRKEDIPYIKINWVTIEAIHGF